MDLALKSSIHVLKLLIINTEWCAIIKCVRIHVHVPQKQTYNIYIPSSTILLLIETQVDGQIEERLA